MAELVHVYRLSDCIERIYRSTGPVLVVPCNHDCHPGNDLCVHQCFLQPLADLPLPIIAIHERDLPQILILHPGASWNHALLFYGGRVARHWKQIPSRTEVDAALAELDRGPRPCKL